MKSRYAGVNFRNWNPWWFHKDWFNQDHHLTTFGMSNIKWYPRLYYLLINRVFKKGITGILTIRGPRRVGKTTMIKLLIYTLIEELKVDPRRILYISCDYVEIKDVMEREGSGILQKVILEYLAETEKLKLDKPLFIFLDEASLYKNWALEIKNLVDQGVVSGKLLIYTTGSHSMDLAEASRLLKGRQGQIASELSGGANQYLYPMRFVEYVESLDKELEKFLYNLFFMRTGTRFHNLNALTRRGGLPPPILNLLYKKFNDRLTGFFRQYLLSGGFALTADDLIGIEKISAHIYDDIYDLIIRDAMKFGLDKFILESLLFTLSEQHSKPLNLEKDTRRIAQRPGTSISPKIREITKYLSYLLGTKTIIFVYKLKFHGRLLMSDIKSQAKIYFRDPFLFSAVYAKTHGITDPFSFFSNKLSDTVFMSNIVEGIVASHLSLLPFYMAPSPLFEEEKHIGYFLMRDRELDFIIWYSSFKEPEKQILIPVEVKYKEQLRKEDLAVAKDFAASYNKRVIVVSKNDFKINDDLAIIPVHLFLLFV